MNFNRLQYFVEVVEAQSINKAAKNLMLTPSSLLTTINAMEKELACSLLVRSHNGVTPTYAGRILYNDAKNILAMEEKWLNFSLLSNDSAHNVEIAVVPGIQYSVMPDLVAQFIQHSPPLILLDELISPLEIANYISTHECPIILSGYDQGAYNHILNIVENFNMQYRILGSESYYAYMSTTHPLSTRATLSSHDLADYQLIANNLDVTYNYQIKQLYSAKTLFVKNLLYIPAIINQTNIIAILPGLMRYASNLCNHQIIAHPITDLSFKLDYLVIFPDDTLLTDAARQVIDGIEHYFSKILSNT